MRILLDSIIIRLCLTTDEARLLENIKQICDVICITKRIQKQYEQPGYKFSQLAPALEKLSSLKPAKIEEPNLGPKIEIKGIPVSHKAFIEEAVRMKADYFITERSTWLNAKDTIKKISKLKIVTPGQYIKYRKKK